MILANCLAWSAASAAPAVGPYHSPLDPAFSPDGKILAVTDHTAVAVTFIDPATRQVTATVPLAGPPAGLVWAADGKRLFVSESGASRIAEIEVASAKPVRHLATGRYPHGLALAPKRGLLVTTDWGLDQVRVIDLASGTTKATLPAGRQPTYVAVSPDEKTALVSNLIPATAAIARDHAIDITVVDLETLQTKPAIRLPLGSTNGRALAISGDGATAFVVHTFGRFNLPTTQLDRGWVNTNALSIIDIRSHKLTATVLLDQVMDGAADPWGVALHPSGTLLFITLAGTHQVAVIDLEHLPKLLQGDTAPLANDLAALYRNNLIRRVNLPVMGPRGIAVSPDGNLLAIAGYFTGSVVLCDPQIANPVLIPLGSQPAADSVRQGELAFHDANHCFQRWLSCASCHPGARADGLNWDLLNDGIGNPKNARSMLWAHQTPPMMSLGVRDTVETATRAGFIHIQFVQPKQETIDAVVAYFKSLTPLPSPHRNPDGSLTESAKRGEALFHSDRTQCAVCHPGPLFTDLASHDVGTANPAFDREHKSFDNPSLVEGWRTPPYLHDGSARTLKEVLTTHNKGDQHGTTSKLTPQEIDDLATYLESL